MADVLPFLSKEVREIDALIRQSRANYQAIFPDTPMIGYLNPEKTALLKPVLPSVAN